MDKKDIMPFHLFNHQGNHFLLNIERMYASSIDNATAEMLTRIVQEPDMPLPDNTEEVLKDLDLVLLSNTKNISKTNKVPFPIYNMALFLTNACNLKCIYCYEEGGEFINNNSMDEKTAFQAVDWLIANSGSIKKLHLVFFGGEPLLEFSLMKKIVAYANHKAGEVDKRVAFHLTTNATLLTDEVIAFLKKHNVDVIISVDGPKDIHDVQRPFAGGQGSYDAIIPKIKKLLDVIPRAEGHAVIAEEVDPHTVRDALIDIGFSRVTTGVMSKSMFNKESELHNSASESSKVLKMLQAMELDAEAWISHTINKDCQALAELMKKEYLYDSILQLLHHSKLHFLCKAGLEYVAVSCGGDVYPCHRFGGLDDFKLGSVFTNKLNRDIYYKPPRTYIEQCAGCFAKYHCAGGCKYMNCVYGGSISEPSQDFCQLKRRELEFAAYIYSRLNQDDLAFLQEHNIFPPKPCPIDF